MTRSRVPHLFLAGFLFSSLTSAQSVLTAVGDPLVSSTGGALGTLTAIVSHAVTDAGDFTVHGIRSGNSEVLVEAGGVVRLRQGDVVPSPNPSNATILGFGGIEQNAVGGLAFVVHASASNGEPAYKALFYESQALFRTGVSADAGGFGSGSVYQDIVSFRLARGVDSCAIRALLRVDVGTQFGVIEALIAIESGCATTPGVTRVLAVGDLLCFDSNCTNQTLPVVGLADTADGFDINSNGDVFAAVRLATPTGIIGALSHQRILDGCDGCPVCSTGEVWLETGQRLGFGDDGTRVALGTLVGGGEALIRDGCSVIWRTGDTPPGLPGPLTSFGGQHVAEDGVVFWYGTWADPNPAGGVGIFRNGNAIVRRGVTSIAGAVVTSISDGPRAFRSTGRSGLCAFRGTLSNGTDGVFAVPTTPPNISWAIVPANGCFGINQGTASLVSGTSRIGDAFFIALDDAQTPGATPQLFFSNRPVEQPFSPATGCGLTWNYGEVLLGLGGPNPVFGPVGVPWQPGSPSQVVLGTPLSALNLVGETWYAQAMFFDGNNTSSPYEPVRSTNALAITFGSP